MRAMASDFTLCRGENSETNEQCETDGLCQSYVKNAFEPDPGSVRWVEGKMREAAPVT